MVIEVNLKESANLTLEMFSVDGSLVRHIARTDAQPGNLTFRWDGKNDQGEKVSTGIYYLLVKAGNESTYKSVNFSK